MRIAPSPFASLALGFVVVAACGGKVSLPGPAESDFPAAVASAVCDNLEPCCQKNAFDYSATGCAAQMKASAASLAYGVHHGDSYDPAAAAACVARLAQGAGTCDGSLGLNPLLKACANVYSGARQPGEPCASTADCAPPPAGSTVQCINDSSGSASSEDGGALPSICVVITPDSVGAPCGYQTPSALVDCGSTDFYGAPTSFYCDSRSQTCERSLALDAPCDSSQVDCGPGLVCGGATLSSSATTCVQDPAYAGAVAPGAACQSDMACAGPGWCLHDGAATAVCISSFMTQFCSAKGT